MSKQRHVVRVQAERAMEQRRATLLGPAAAGAPAADDRRQLRNQFNFNERAAQARPITSPLSQQMQILAPAPAPMSVEPSRASGASSHACNYCPVSGGMSSWGPDEMFQFGASTITPYVVAASLEKPRSHIEKLRIS